jgi:RNase P/RNase MRP subunit p29
MAHDRHELIGKQVSLSSNGRPFAGKVIDETRETLAIRDNEGRRKKLLKSTLTINSIDGQSITIDGNTIRVRPHERIKNG